MDQTVRIGVVMDPIHAIKPYKDSTLAMLLAAQRRSWDIFYMEPRDLRLEQNEAVGRMCPLKVADHSDDWFQLDARQDRPLTDLQIILMRKDPPFDMDYIYATYLLDRASERGVLVVNDPMALRNANEKLFALEFPELCPASLVSSNASDLRAFLQEQGEIVVKPLDAMGGQSIYRLQRNDANFNVIMETMTHYGKRMIMAQRYLPEIDAGDKRVLVIDGEAVPYMLARIPAKGEFRGNLAAGGRGEAQTLGDTERAIVERIGPTLRQRGIVFAGIDVIGDRLTEINITSPTCIRELDKAFHCDIAGDIMTALERRLGNTG